jgi:hypothetical protein
MSIKAYFAKGALLSRTARALFYFSCCISHECNLCILRFLESRIFYNGEIYTAEYARWFPLNSAHFTEYYDYCHGNISVMIPNLLINSAVYLAIGAVLRRIVVQTIPFHKRPIKITGTILAFLAYVFGGTFRMFEHITMRVQEWPESRIIFDLSPFSP